MRLVMSKKQIIESLRRQAEACRAMYSKRDARNARGFDRAEGKALGLERAAWMLEIQVPRKRRPKVKAMSAARMKKHSKSRLG